MTPPKSSCAPLNLLLERHPDARKCREKYIARCRAHADSSPSLSLSCGKDGRALVHCFAGCKPCDVLAAVGLEMRDLFPDSDKPRTKRGPNKAAVAHERCIVAIGISLLTQGISLPASDLERLETAHRRLAELESRK